MAGAAVLTVADTIARSFLLSVDKRGDKPAIREKKFGIWQPTSWRQWLQISRDIAFALHASGFKPGDVASILANAVPEWVYADMGILCAGGVASGIYPTDSAAQVEYLINDSRTRIVFAEDEEQLDKLLSCRARCPTLEKIVVFDMEGLAAFSDPMVMSLAEFIALGQNHCAGPRGIVGRDGRQPHRRRSCRPRLHLGHHRSAQGRDAFQPQRHAPDAARQRSVPVDR